MAVVMAIIKKTFPKAENIKTDRACPPWLDAGVAVVVSAGAGPKIHGGIGLFSYDTAGSITYKKGEGERTIPNYRHISNLPIVSNMFE